jgi:hypothetical protein
MNPQKDKSYFCPKCQSPHVNLSVLAGGEAACQACTWKGPNTELLGYEFESGFNNAEEVIVAFAKDIKLLLAREGVGLKLGQLIIKWGFVTNIDVPTLSRYVGAVARGIAVAVLEERRSIEKEKQSVS